MAAGSAPELSLLMDTQTFLDNFENLKYPHETYLCYEVECPEGDLSIPLDERKGWLCNEGAYTGQGGGPHAEEIFLEWMASWKLDKGLRYRVTCYISYTPCEDCAYELAKFLRENTHVDLRIFAARIYAKKSQDWKAGLCTLKAAGAKIAMMTLAEFEHCWKRFVNHQGRLFEPWPDLNVESRRFSWRLKGIL